MAVFVFQQQDVAQKIKTGWGFVRISAFGPHNGFVDMGAIQVRHLPAFIYVGAVDREAGDGLTDNIAQRLAGKIASIPVGGRNLIQHMGEDVDLAGQ